MQTVPVTGKQGRQRSFAGSGFAEYEEAYWFGYQIPQLRLQLTTSYTILAQQ